MRHLQIYIGFIFLLFLGCNQPENVRVTDELPPMYPDYIDITIPPNIAPLHFLLRNNPEQIEVKIKGKENELKIKRKGNVQIPEKAWRNFLTAEKGNTLEIEITAKIQGQWIKYAPVKWLVAYEEIDPYLSYRLIEPGYEVWNRLQLVERNLESFSERIIADNNLTETSCMNCHIYGNQDAELSLFHLRGKKGGTILNRNGSLRKLNTKDGNMFSAATYGNFHPNGQYGVFSTNIIIPGFHTFRGEKLEVYDTVSDIIILDFDNNSIFTTPLLSSKNSLETFPVFSSDGSFIYFCSAELVELPDSIRNLQYNLCRISFDATTGTFGEKVDTIWSAKENRGSVCHPKTSPDGKFIMYTVADYGTFPIWHREARLELMNLESETIIPMPQVNSDYSESYHSWSSNSRWTVFASKREDGLYGKPYFCYIDEEGNAHKPFVLPQRDPTWYDYNLKSFNIPELSKGKLPFNAMDIEHIYHEGETEKMIYKP